MAKYNTGNPLGSKSPKDLSDNAQNLDDAVNDLGKDTWLDRFGKIRVTLSGYGRMFSLFMAQSAARFQQFMTGAVGQFEQFLLSSGYQDIGDYQPGLQITERNQIFWKDGELYRAGASLPLPYVTTGDWALESASFVAVGDAALRQQLASDTGAELVFFRRPEVGSVARTLQDKMRESVSVKDFGGVGDGIHDDTAAALAMQEAFGHVLFSSGNYRLKTSVFDVALHFLEGAHISVDAEHTVVVRAAVYSPKQWIFRGAGDYRLEQDENARGENARHVHASWFGAFPSVINNGDQAPAIDRAFAAMGNVRESVVEFDIGGYVMSSTARITRGGWVRGAGSRRTVFKVDGDGYPCFIDTVSGLAKITDCNFENIPGAVTNRQSPYVMFAGNEAELYNIRLGESRKGIVTSGNSPRIFNIAAAYGFSPGAGSDLIHIAEGSGALVQGIRLATSSMWGPEAIVRLGGYVNGVNKATVRDIYHMTPSISVIVEATSSNIDGVLINGVNYNGFAGGFPAQLILLKTEGQASIENVLIDGVIGSSRSLAMVTLRQGSTGFMRRISIDNVLDKRVDGNGIELIRTNGILELVSVGPGVQVKSRDNPIYTDGIIGSLNISPGVEKDVNNAVTHSLRIEDDEVGAIDLRRSVFSGVLLVSAGNQRYGIYVVRSAVAPTYTVINQSPNMAIVNTQLSGQSGVDGNITVGVTNGLIYLENRSGAAVTASMTLLG